MKIGRGPADESGNGILKLLALLEEKSGLSSCGVQERFFLSDVEAGGEAAFVAGIDEIQALFERSDGALEDADFGVELAEREVIARQFGGDDQLDVFKIGSARLVSRLSRFNAAAATAEKIGFVADRKGQSECILRGGPQLDLRSAGRTVAGEALTLSGRRGGEERKLRGDLQRGKRTGLFQMRRGDFDRLIGAERFLFERVELRIVKNSPPFALGEGIAGSALAPGFHDVPMRGNVGGGTPIFGPDRAAAQENQTGRAESRAEAAAMNHRCAPFGLGEAEELLQKAELRRVAPAEFPSP